MYLSVAEINKNFDGEWVYAIDCHEDELGNVLGGKVVLHSPNRDIVIRGIGKYEKEVDTLTYLRYVGRIPSEVSIQL